MTTAKEIADNPPAFPQHPSRMVDDPATGKLERTWGYEGMSLRDWFAGQALPSIITHGVTPEENRSVAEIISQASYVFADAMLSVRSELLKKEEGDG